MVTSKSRAHPKSAQQEISIITVVSKPAVYLVLVDGGATGHTAYKPNAIYTAT